MIFSTNWADLTEQAVLADVDSLPPGWQLVSASRSAILFKVGPDVLVKRVRILQFGMHTAPLARVAIEASAPWYLGRWVPETLHVDPDRGVVIRQFVPGEALSRLSPARIDVAAMAKEFGQFIMHCSNKEGPQTTIRPLAIVCPQRLQKARGLSKEIVTGLLERILEGNHPSHGDLSPSNVILTDDRATFIDAETLDSASVAWDLGYILRFANVWKIPLKEWRSEVLHNCDLPSQVIADADLISACAA